jgi:hypothetical protein
MKANVTERGKSLVSIAERKKTPVVCHINPSSRSSSSTILLHDAVVRDALDTATSHARAHIALESITIASQILSSLLVQRITSVGLEEQELQTDNNRIQVQHWLPVLAQDVQAHVSLEIDVGVVDLLRALDLRRLVREVLADVECKVKGAVLVHALVGCDGQAEVQNVVGVWEGCCHGATERQFREICTDSVSTYRAVVIHVYLPFCTRSCAAVTFFFFAPPDAAAWSFCCCCFCQDQSAMSSKRHPRTTHTIDQIFNILNVCFGGE